MKRQVVIQCAYWLSICLTTPMTRVSSIRTSFQVTKPNPLRVTVVVGAAAAVGPNTDWK